MNRKLAWLAALSILALSAAPLPAQDEDKPLHKTSYRVINVHRHCDSPSAEAIQAELEVCDRVGVSAVVILDGGDTAGKVPAWMEIKKKHPERIIVFSNVPWGRIKTETFFDDIVRDLPAQQRLGIQGVKIFKQLGMSIKGPDGKLLRGDDPRLDPFWAKCGELGLPVLIHMADPREYWYPLTYNTFHYGMKTEQSQFYDRDKMPSWEDLIEQRNNILKKHPKTKFIGAHMGSLTFDLKQLGETFDKYPNFCVDCSARTRILGRLNPMAVRDFFTKYQDRILFGTDSTALYNVDPKDEKAVAAWKDKASRFYSRHLEYFETNRLDIVEPYGWGKDWLRISGVKLPPAVLEKFYHANAERLILKAGAAGRTPTDKTVAQTKETELAKLAARMKPGTWAELKTEGYTADLLKVQNHHILEYTGAATWEPASRQVLFVGQGHYSALKFIGFSADSNAWKLRPTPSWWKGDAETGKGPIGHAYYNNTVDPTRGILYHHQSATNLVHRYDVAKDEWTTLPEIKGANTGHGTAIAYFPERKGLVRVLGGTVHFYDEDKKEWQPVGEKLPMGPYHNVAQYSGKHKLVLFGGGNNSKKLYAMDAAGKIRTDLKEAPTEIGINTAVLTSDPVTGDFLVLTKDDKFHAYDSTTDAWKELPTEGMPFAMKGSSFDVVATPVASHGVTLFFTAQRKGLKVCLYKHADLKK